MAVCTSHISSFKLTLSLASYPSCRVLKYTFEVYYICTSVEEILRWQNLFFVKNFAGMYTELKGRKCLKWKLFLILSDIRKNLKIAQLLTIYDFIFHCYRKSSKKIWILFFHRIKYIFLKNNGFFKYFSVKNITFSVKWKLSQK